MGSVNLLDICTACPCHRFEWLSTAVHAIMWFTESTLSMKHFHTLSVTPGMFETSERPDGVGVHRMIGAACSVG